jgi:hypothetical protein
MPGIQNPPDDATGKGCPTPNRVPAQLEAIIDAAGGARIGTGTIATNGSRLVAGHAELQSSAQSIPSPWLRFQKIMTVRRRMFPREQDWIRSGHRS